MVFLKTWIHVVEMCLPILQFLLKIKNKIDSSKKHFAHLCFTRINIVQLIANLETLLIIGALARLKIVGGTKMP